MSLVRGVSIADYKANSQDNWGFAFTSCMDKNEKNDENIVDDNTDIIEGQRRNIENSNNHY